MSWFQTRIRRSGGERNVLFAVLAVAIFSAILAIDVVESLAADQPVIQNMTFFTFWALLAGAVGGTCGLLTSYHKYFGYAGARGWLWAFLGGVMVSGIGAVVGGTMILPYYGTMFAPLKLIIVMFEQPVLAVLWVGMVICVHKLIARWREERDSIFKTDAEPLY
ncbi:MAG: hypothetical protein AAFQ64_09805 [Pseudomonadota bacterium]